MSQTHHSELRLLAEATRWLSQGHERDPAETAAMVIDVLRIQHLLAAVTPAASRP